MFTSSVAIFWFVFSIITCGHEMLDYICVCVCANRIETFLLNLAKVMPTLSYSCSILLRPKVHICGQCVWGCLHAE